MTHKPQALSLISLLLLILLITFSTSYSDHLGSTTLVTNQSGDIVEENFYEPFGEVYSGNESSRYLYTGQELDQDTDLYYYGARYYDPSKNQFVQPDPLIQDIYNPLDLNRYAYVRNNPYKYTDPTGNNPLAVVAVGAGLIVGGVQGISTYKQTRDLDRALRSGTLAGLATGVSIATLGTASVTAVAGGTALRYVGTSGTSSLATGSALFGIGAAEEVAQQTLVEGRNMNEISYSDVVISGGTNAIGVFGPFDRAPGVISRLPGQFYPSSSGSALQSVIGSQVAESLYSTAAEITTQSGYTQLSDLVSRTSSSQSSSKSGNRNSGAKDEKREEKKSLLDRIGSLFRSGGRT